MDLSVARKMPLGNGILTMENEAQAIVRADPKQGDKGGDAARAALALVRLKREARYERRTTLRRASRRVQALYQMEVAGKGLNEILAEFESHWIGARSRGRAIQAGGNRVFPRRLGRAEDQVAIDRQIDECCPTAGRCAASRR